jgi:hypothetical protein
MNLVEGSGQMALLIVSVQMLSITALAVGQKLRELRRDPNAETVSVGDAS